MAENDWKSSSLRAMVALGLILMLILGVLFVMERLHQAATMQDCFASGRTNCAPITSVR